MFPFFPYQKNSSPTSTPTSNSPTAPNSVPNSTAIPGTINNIPITISSGTICHPNINSITLPRVVNIGTWFPPIQLDLDFPKEACSKQEKITIGTEEGYLCSKCEDFYPMAELNQPDGVEEFYFFTCFGCRKGLKTIFKNGV